MRWQKSALIAALFGVYVGQGASLGIADVLPARNVAPGSQTPPDAGKGRLDKELIRRVIRQHIMEVRTCYERELSKNSKLGGRVLIHFIIGTGGEVTKSEVESSTLGNTVVEECIAAAVRSWSFPKPQGGVVSVTYPFVLQTDPDQGQSTPSKAPRPVLPPT